MNEIPKYSYFDGGDRVSIYDDGTVEIQHEGRAWRASFKAWVQLASCQCPECKITPHLSSCAVHNEPAFPKGPCDCGAIKK